MNLIFLTTHSRYLFSLLLILCGLQSAAAQSASCTSPTRSTEKAVHIIFGGDIVLGNSFVVENIPKDWEERYFMGVRSTLKSADLLIGNLEQALTEHKATSKNTGSGRAFAFRSPPHYADLLFQEGFKILNIANNHAYDFGETGFKDTYNHLHQAGIAVAGIKNTTAKVSLQGLNLAVLGFTYSNRFNTIFDLEDDAELVRKAKADGSYVIATFHAGAEGSPAIWHDDEEEEFLGENRGNTVAFSRAMIDAGADIVVGHGPHVLRAVECYKGKPIIYSLGNYVGVGGLSAKNFAAVSALLDISVSPDGGLQTINLLPLRFNEQKLPQIDPQEYGTRLVNYLGKNALYAGDFMQFPVMNGSQDDFNAWLKVNLPHKVSAKKPTKSKEAKP
jgi:poly-gamma-glutamate capsule biosynthesis protein CapA/YwtB (metallophosphatase superfamily)